jgi:hypothetical protein
MTRIGCRDIFHLPAPFQRHDCDYQRPWGSNQLIAAARAQVKAVDPDQPIYNIRTMEEIRGESVARNA